MKMEIDMRGNGLMIRKMEEECRYIQMALGMMDGGVKERDMDWDEKLT